MTPNLNKIPTDGALFGITDTTFHQASHSNAASLLLTLHPIAAYHLLESLSVTIRCIYLSANKSDETLLKNKEIPIVYTMDTELAYSEIKNILLAELKLKTVVIETHVSDQLIAAQTEWENVENMQTFRESGILDNSQASQNSAKLLNSTHALEYFRNKRMLEYINRIVLPPEPTGIRKFF